MARYKKNRGKRAAIRIVTFFTILFCIGLYIGKKIAEINTSIRTAVVVNNSNARPVANQNSSENEAKTQPPADPIMNKNELSIIPYKNTPDSQIENIYKPDGHKVAYLTFDDGPSPNITPGILKTLDKYKIKATFFVIGQMAAQNSNVLKMEAAYGETIGNHTYSHNYKYIYANTKNFIGDLDKCTKTLKSILGEDYNSKLIRFPGGSFGARLAPFRKAALDEGYHYVDWNDLTGDAEAGNVPVPKLLEELKKYTHGHEHVIILMHDAPAKETTLEALPQVIEYLMSEGYTFKTFQ